jgi:sucrose-6-phosphate hydrolase SacC (GH32 family)
MTPPLHFDRRLVFLALGAALGLLSPTTPRAQAAYSELYRPQFHFTPSSGWIGDPDGLVRYQGKYHLFWWGHAVSSDLVFWSQQVWPMTGDDGSFTYYTGSVVVDKTNTSGLGASALPPMVAVYTAHRIADGLETQCLSSSTNSTNFAYYSGNPVLDISSTSFRDPDVFWDFQSGRWIMVVALPADHKVNFYTSSNLKSWTYLSQFGPVGAHENEWEVPNLFQLPVDGNTNNLKWVLECGMGPNNIQYFVGAFNGTNFSLDANCQAYLTQGTGLPGTVFANFEDTTYTGWNVSGTAFGSGPAAGTLSTQQTVSGYLGSRLVNSYNGGDGAVGTLTSGIFTITNNCLNFLIGGGNHPGQTCINLLVGGSVVATATGQNSELLKWAGWNVSAWKGRSGQIQIVDGNTGDWGHIDIDQIIFSDVLLNVNREHANWADWGSDFYAARPYRDYDQAVPTTSVWLGWMGNWTYATSVPTSWGQGAESIPRQIGLVSSPAGNVLAQSPWPRLTKLRRPGAYVPSRTIQGTVSLAEFQPRRNTYELEAIFTLDSTNQNFGLNLCVSGTNKVVLGYDGSAGNLYLDRRASGDVAFSSNFPTYVTAPFFTSQSYLKFHVFVDQSSIEVFANDGQVVLTSLIFPANSSLGVQLFSLTGSVTLRCLSAWELNSIWGVPPP